MFHISRSKKGPIKEIEIGSIIWLFSTLKSPWGILPPSLDAKFVVGKIEKSSDGITTFIATNDSTWFPLSDATNVIKDLRTRDRYNNEKYLWPDQNKSIGFYTQSLRQLNNGEILEQYGSQILNSEFDFISYRIKDGTKKAFTTAQMLIKKGNIVFWDRYCLPRRLVERREIVNDEALNNYLMQKLSISSRVFGIETPKYCEEKSYSLREAELAKKLEKYISLPAGAGL
jgi:hypothetical protein